MQDGKDMPDNRPDVEHDSTYDVNVTLEISACGKIQNPNGPLISACTIN
jgi:hypothetical protein